MQRRSHSGNALRNSGNASALHFSAADLEGDDGGGGYSSKHKQKTSSLLRLPSKLAKSKYSKSTAPDYCLPGVPVVLKLILLSFVGFAVLVVLTAKGRHAHWRYASPHMPEPLLVKNQGEWQVKRPGVGAKVGEAIDSRSHVKRESSLDATKRMLSQSSKFVDSEKKLKQQLRKLLDKQNEQKKSKPKDPNESVLGIKISNRYLGEDLLPYPESKGGEKEWEKKMEQRKAELKKEDETEWKELMRQYNEVMENYGEENEHVDHIDGLEQNDIEEIVDGDTDGNQSSEENDNIVRPPKGTEQWPSPAEKAGADTTILLKPAFGSHHPSSDAILVFAEGYDLPIYLAFVESLVNTGYSGDLVFSISNEEKLKPDVKQYLQSKNSDSGGVNIVAYEVDWSCFKQSGEVASGSGEGINHCKMNNAFGDALGNPIADPRSQRPVATARYELYWMWSLRYSRESWLMLIDARDVWFQKPPFDELTARGKVSGELHLFGENAEVVNIGSSNFNRRWLIQAYGEKAVSPFFKEPVICSGSTIGNQDAIETYLRAMVAQYDATLCKSKGCDQGFHNYLYYSGQLGSADEGNEGISNVIVHEQGKGIINNLGALRTKPLKEWGLYDAEKELVLNWDGSISAVAHQYDRDKEVNIMVKAKKRHFNQQWKSSHR
mmetsp:Transcript_28365/g.59908  ORF Transcript_28365/g.59908 Transcript_28365/m.59908 type:complete len:662 (-) Transcript_28365:193-2178(-)